MATGACSATVSKNLMPSLARSSRLSQKRNARTVLERKSTTPLTSLMLSPSLQAMTMTSAAPEREAIMQMMTSPQGMMG
eukprot:2415890-Ditylum_brightwellii.AAC.1